MMRQYRLLGLIFAVTTAIPFWTAVCFAAEETSVTSKPVGNLDTLVYNNGDRAQGQLVSNDGTTIVFRSVQFGVLAVLSSDAKVITFAEAEKDKQAATDKTNEAQDVNKHWQGHIAFAAEVVHDSDRHRSDVVDAKLERKWKTDELSFTARYEFDSAQGETNSDVLKSSADWRHNLGKGFFTIYRPITELNHSNMYQGNPADYFLLQQEVGLGRVLYDKPNFNLRIGFSELFYDVWTLSNKRHFAKAAPAGFIENETKLPSRTTFTIRMVRYYRTSGSQGGWEGQAELSKKLTNTLRLALHYEIRHHDPDIRVTDYESLRLLLGLDF